MKETMAMNSRQGRHLQVFDQIKRESFANEDYKAQRFAVLHEASESGWRFAAVNSLKGRFKGLSKV